MNRGSFRDEIEYNDERIVTKVMLESSFSKEIRILLKKGQMLKEHKAPFPIIVHILEGEIDFGVQGEVLLLEKGSVITLEGHVPHNLTARKDSMVRLTLSKGDDVDRVKQAAEPS